MDGVCRNLFVECETRHVASTYVWQYEGSCYSATCQYNCISIMNRNCVFTLLSTKLVPDSVL